MPRCAGGFGRGDLVVDRRFVSRLIEDIEKNVVLLEAMRDVPAETLRDDPHQGYTALYALQICVEALLNVSHHMIAELGLTRPESTVHAVEILTRSGVLQDSELAGRLPDIVRFRNLIVHRYWDIRWDLVHGILQHNIGDLRAFAAAIESFMDRNDATPGDRP